MFIDNMNFYLLIFRSLWFSI